MNCSYVIYRIINIENKSFLFNSIKNFHCSQTKYGRKHSRCLRQFQSNCITNKIETNELIQQNQLNSDEIDKHNEYIQHVFKWGIGNRFRADPENRYHPVHLSRAKEVTVRKDYFNPVNSNIIYEKLNEQWEVFWYEHNKLNAKPFPIKKYGIEAAKKEAIKFYESLQQNNRLCNKPHYACEVEGVHFDAVTNCWVAFYRSNNVPVCRSFSTEYHGFEEAKKLAVERVQKYQK